jgi:hypothetical protein
LLWHIDLLRTGPPEDQMTDSSKVGTRPREVLHLSTSATSVEAGLTQKIILAQLAVQKIVMDRNLAEETKALLD